MRCRWSPSRTATFPFSTQKLLPQESLLWLKDTGASLITFWSRKLYHTIFLGIKFFLILLASIFCWLKDLGMSEAQPEVQNSIKTQYNHRNSWKYFYSPLIILSMEFNSSCFVQQVFFPHWCRFCIINFYNWISLFWILDTILKKQRSVQLFSLLVIFPLPNSTPKMHALCGLKTNCVRAPKSFSFFPPQKFWYLSVLSKSRGISLLFGYQQRMGLARNAEGRWEGRLQSSEIPAILPTLNWSLFGIRTFSYYFISSNWQLLHPREHFLVIGGNR